MGQTNFRPGYVVPLSGDTLRGEVDSRGAQRNARVARFRTAAAAAITEYQPQQLRGYGFTGDRLYQTETVLTTDSTQRQSATATADAVKQTVFLEVIERGAASLLYLRDYNNADHYYLQMRGQQPQELIQTSQQVVEKGITYQRKSDEFRRTLAAATQQCLPLQKSISELRYGQTEFARLIRRYNECVGGTSVSVASATRKNRVQLGVVVGAQRSQLFLQDYPNLETKSASAISPVVGLGANLRFVGASRTVSARVEALYEKQSYEAEGKNTSGNPRFYRANLESIRIPIMVRYTYPKGALRPFVYAGYGLNLFLDNTNEIKTNSGWIPWVAKPRTLEHGLLGGVGLTTARASGRNIALDLRYERSNGFSDATEIGGHLNRFYVLLSYDLTK